MILMVPSAGSQTSLVRVASRLRSAAMSHPDPIVGRMSGRPAKTSVPRESEIYCGDAFDLIGKLPESSVDLIVTSPPYWCQRVYEGQEDHNWAVQDAWRREGESLDVAPPYDWYRANGGMLGLEPTPDWYVAHLAEWFDRARPVLKADGNVWVNIGDTYFARWASIRPGGRQGLGGTRRVRRRTPMGDYRQEKQLLMVPARFAILMQGRRWILRNDLIWSKPNVPPRPERDRLRLTHEHLFHFVRRPSEGRAAYFYDLDEVEPGARDVVTVNARSGAHGHSATFPPEVIRPRVLSSSPVGGVVLDPFCGTGRALTIAAAHGRTAIGFESAESFAEVAARDLASVISTRLRGSA
ncbi:MAG: site-specific DNA-methyltransferase [bacterium]|nr:site-specific DNA-methyltransferase [bacterium]